jgi:hypothetical protein
MHSPAWKVALKLFLPSWDFFNDFGPVIRLESRWLRPGVAALGWRPVFTRHTTGSWARTLFNPAGNLELLEHSWVDRAATEAGPEPDGVGALFATTETHARLVRIARARLLAAHREPGEDSFQFRLVQIEPGGAFEVIFTSVALPATRDET